ncbi:transglutaminaseTgpA domain-containing protein [Algiphilus sp.]|uniref:transglutaminase family protein n=1 Tax=Algiphilus sp. TaxID=1872431 RepID=UPI003B521850
MAEAMALPRERLLRLLPVVAIVLAPHALHLPPWIGLVVGTLIIWRGVAAQRAWPLPGRWVRVALTIAGFAGVWLSFGRSSGQVAGTAMLTLMIALKLTELQDRRGEMVVLLLLYFTLFTHFLRDQALWTVLWMLVAVLLITALLIDGQRLQRAGWRADLSGAGRLLLLALPLMLVLWVLFPRISGPLWGTPGASDSARTGMSDTMSPGDIASLIQSDAVAFRVSFEGAVPDKQERYWRGPVLWYTDGRTWYPHRRSLGAPERDASASLVPEGPAIDYRLTLEPQTLSYIFALDYAPPGTLPAPLHLDAGGAVRSASVLNTTTFFDLRAYPAARLGSSLEGSLRERALQLPANANPRSRALAADWRRQTRQPMALAQRALAYFRNEGFIYTLSPPLLGTDSVDAFLFESRRGFCEHFAGSFVTLMRAAGVPARVVLGYQGAERSQVGDYYIVRQSDAHAWAEIWDERAGWLRIDPTAAVAPDRIEFNLDTALEQRGEQRALPWAGQWAIGDWIGARWDFLNMQWDRWILAYGPELQRALLSRIGLGDWQRMLFALTALIALMMAIIAALAIRANLREVRRDPLAREWQRICCRLARSGLAPEPQEGPLDYAGRVRGHLQGEALRAFNDAADAYIRGRYLAAADADALLVLQTRMAAARRRMPMVFAAGLPHPGRAVPPSSS